MTQLLNVPHSNPPVRPSSDYAAPTGRSTPKQSAVTPCNKITFNCPKPSRQCLFNKHAAFQHTPPPNKILGNRHSFEDDDEDENEEESERSDSESDYESDEDYESSQRVQSEDEYEGVFLSD